MRRAWAVAGTAVVAYLAGRQVGRSQGEASMYRLHQRMVAISVGRYRRDYYTAELARHSLTGHLERSRAANRALEDRNRGISSMARLVAGQVITSLDGVSTPEARDLLRSASLLSEVADAHDLAS